MVWPTIVKMPGASRVAPNLGSVATRVVSLAPCPVLTVRGK
jgi:nucleotide-binding universal stress UspA family protein